jgi:hypothetical protein
MNLAQTLLNVGKGIAQPFTQFGTAVAYTPQAIYRLAQNKPITDIQQKVFKTTDQGQIAKNIIGNTAQLGLTALAGPMAKASLAAPTLAKQTLFGAAQGGLLGGAMNLASMTAQNQRITPQGVLQGAALGAGLGAATPLGRAMYLNAKANPLNEAGFVQLPKGRREVIVRDPRTSPDLAEQVQKGFLSGDVNLVQAKNIQYGGGVKGAPLQRSRVDYWKNIIMKQGTDPNNSNSIDPLIVSLSKKTGQALLEDGKHRLQAMRELGIKDVPVIVQQNPLRGAALQAQLGR